MSDVACVPSPEKVDFTWPAKVDLFGIGISPTTYEETTERVIAAAQQGVPGVVSCHAVHAVVTTSSDPALREKVNTFDMITPDGQPVRWALNLIYGCRLRDRVYGPDLMLCLCERAAKSGVSIYLYGGSPEVAEDLQENLRRRFPDLKIAGYESPPYRALSEKEEEEMVDRIQTSGAGLVFIGLGCPKQDVFAFEHREDFRAVQICVGAAFDFHAGAKKSAPGWMQRSGLEWLYRLLCEPRRLWRRYLVTNSVFVAKFTVAWLRARCTWRKASLSGNSGGSRPSS